LAYTSFVASPVKERLTGAIILIVAVVIVVPELFSGKSGKLATTGAPDAQPAEEGPPLRSYTMDLGAGNAQDQSALTPEPATLPQETGRAPDPVASQGIPDSGPAPAPVEDVAPAPAPTPPTPAPTSKPAKPAAAATAPAATPARGWWVQLGSFSARANADRLASTLSGAGYTVAVSPTDANGKELFRVRAGPVADREAAVALQGRLSAAGHKGSLVAP
jgi:DedD protein